MTAWIRLRSLIVKELLAVTRDPRSRMILIVPPVVQLVVFAFAATMEITRIDIAVLNQDSGYWSRELIQRIQGSPSFRTVTLIAGKAELEDAIVYQSSLAAMQIGPTFSRDLEAGQPASVQVILDGRKPNATQIVAGYLNQIISGLAAEAVPGGSAGPKVTVETRNWFNPNLDDRWRMVPSLVATISLLMGLIVSALSVAREREVGTFDQLLVSPLRTHEIMFGKILSPMIISLFHVTMFILTAVFIFGIPLRGNVAVLYISALVFQFSVVSVGLFISSASATQQQAVLGTFVFMVPAMILSGFVTPIANMPYWLQPTTLVNPLRYFLVIVNGVFLKDMSISEIVANLIPLAGIGIVTMIAAAIFFRRRLE